MGREPGERRFALQRAAYRILQALLLRHDTVDRRFSFLRRWWSVQKKYPSHEPIVEPGGIGALLRFPNGDQPLGDIQCRIPVQDKGHQRANTRFLDCCLHCA